MAFFSVAVFYVLIPCSIVSQAVIIDHGGIVSGGNLWQQTECPIFYLRCYENNVKVKNGLSGTKERKLIVDSFVIRSEMATILE